MHEPGLGVLHAWTPTVWRLLGPLPTLSVVDSGSVPAAARGASLVFLAEWTEVLGQSVHPWRPVGAVS